MEQSHADVRPSEKSLRMTCRIECPDCGCRPPSFERVEPDEAILFVLGRPSAQELELRCASDWRSADGIDRIFLSELGIADPAYAPGMISMCSVFGAAVAFH